MTDVIEWSQVPEEFTAPVCPRKFFPVVLQISMLFDGSRAAPWSSTKVAPWLPMLPEPWLRMSAITLPSVFTIMSMEPFLRSV